MLYVMLPILSAKTMIAYTLANGDIIINLLMEQPQATLIIIILAYTEIITDAQINQRCEQKKYNELKLSRNIEYLII